MHRHHSSRGAIATFGLISLLMHGGLALIFTHLYQEQKEKMRRISGVELLDLEMPRTVRVTVPKRKTSLLQALKRIIVPKPKKLEKPMDIMKKILKKSKEIKPDKLVDKTDPMLRKMKEMDLDKLKQKRDEKLAELTKLTKGNVRKIRDLMSLDAKLVDKRTALVRLGGAGPALAEVGVRGSTKTITDVPVHAPARRRRGALETLTPLARLVEKKERMKRALTASAGILDMSSKRKSSELRISEFREVMASKTEIKKARELLALQEIITEKEGARERRPETMIAAMPPLRKARKPGQPEPPGKPPPEKTEPVKIVKAAPLNVLEKLKKLKRLESLSMVEENPVEISGPIKDREVVSAFLPRYPEWAKSEEIEADVTLRFFVTSRGKVKKNITIEKTSGYRKLDQLTIESLSNWVFAPIGREGRDQWGLINFKFRLE